MNNPLNLSEVNQEQAFSLCKFFIETNQNLFLFGQRGTGKTKILMQSAKACHVKINYINLSVLERPDLAGYPNLFATGDIVTFKSPYYLPTLEDGYEPDSVILFDEVDKASPDIIAPLLEILQFKTINGRRINAKACLLTGNLLSEGAYSHELNTALLDRGGKYLLRFDFQSWYKWAKENNIHDFIMSFLYSNPASACSTKDLNQYAIASPRGWEYISNSIFYAEKLKVDSSDMIFNIVSGYVGKEIGLTFKSWYENYRILDPIIKDLLFKDKEPEDYSKWEKTKQLVFILNLFYSAKIETIKRVKANNKKPFLLLEVMCSFLKRKNVEPEILNLAIGYAFDLQTIAMYNLYECEPFTDMAGELTDKLTSIK